MRPHLLPLGGLLLLALLLTAPLAAHLDTVLPGPHGDSFFHLWNFWWLRTALQEGLDPLFCPYVLYPTGCELALHSFTFTNSCLSLLLSGWLSLPATYNVIIILQFIAGGGAMYALAWSLTASRAGAFVAACAWTFAPYHYQHLCRPDVAGYVTMPLTVLYLLRVWRQPRLIDGLAFGACFAVTAYSTVYYLFSQTFLIAVIGGCLLLGDRARVLNPAALRVFLAGTLLATLLLLPSLLPMLALRQRAEFGATSLHVHALISADPAALLTPPPHHPLWGALFADAYARFTGTEPVVYLGWVLVPLALSGLVQMPRRTRWLWLTVALVFLVLALGPLLHWRGTFVWPGAAVKNIPLPYLALYEWFPPIRSARAPSRFIVVALLALCVAAAFAVRRLATFRPRLAALLGGLLLLDFLAVPVPTVPLSVPALYADIAADPSPGAVLEVPVTDYPSVLQYYQTVYHRPLVIGAVTHIPPWRFTFLGETPVVRELYNLSLLTAERERELAGTGMASLAQAGIGWVVVHPELIDNPAVTTRCVQFLTAVLAQSPQQRDGLLIWRIATE